ASDGLMPGSSVCARVRAGDSSDTRILKEARYLTGARGPAATGLGKQLRAAQARVVVPFEDNRHLNRLLGEYDGHLALLEERLGIGAQAHGNVVTLTGPTTACETARE